MISVRVRTQPPNLAKVISEAPRMARGLMTVAAAKYLLGDGRRGLKHYKPYKHITRKRAYPPTGWQSDRQRRYVMAMIRKGRIDPGYPHRTGRLQRGWVLTSTGAKTTIINRENYAGYVMGDKEQANLNRLAGWRVVSDIIKTNEKGMIQAAERELGKYLKSKGLI